MICPHPTLKASTAKLYETLLEAYVIPALGGVRLQSVPRPASIRCTRSSSPEGADKVTAACPPPRCATSTGLRRAEALGLQWQDVDVEGARLTVSKGLAYVGTKAVLSEPKTQSGRRLVSLPTHTVAALRAHKKRQAATRLAFGPEYDTRGFVFAGSSTITTLDIYTHAVPSMLESATEQVACRRRL